MYIYCVCGARITKGLKDIDACPECGVSMKTTLNILPSVKAETSVFTAKPAKKIHPKRQREAAVIDEEDIDGDEEDDDNDNDDNDTGDYAGNYTEAEATNVIDFDEQSIQPVKIKIGDIAGQSKKAKPLSKIKIREQGKIESKAEFLKNLNREGGTSRK